MRSASLVLPTLLTVSACSIFNSIDDVKHLGTDAGTGGSGGGGEGDDAGEDVSSIVDTGVVTPDVGAADNIVDAGSTPVFVIGGPAGDGGTVAQLATLDPENGREIGPNNRFTVAAGKKLAGLVYDGEREDLFYIFEQSATDGFAPATLHVSHLNTRTGTWKDISTATNLPPLASDPSLVVLHNTIVYRTNIQGPPASVGLAFLNTKNAENAAKVAAISVGTAPVMSLPFNPVGLIGLPQMGDTSLQGLDIVHQDPPPCTTIINDAGVPFCGVYLHRVTISNAGVSPLQMVTTPVGQFLWKDGAGISFATDAVKSLDLLVFPPTSYDGMGEGLGAVQQFDDSRVPQLLPAIDFGPVKSPWLVSTTMAQCERIVLTIGFISAPWLYAVPLDRAGTPAISQSTIENGSKLVYEPVTRTVLAPNRRDLRPFTLGGTPAKPTIALRSTGWMAPTDIDATFTVAKAPMFPKCN